MARAEETVCPHGIGSDVIGLFYPMKEVPCNGSSQVLVTPLRASFNKHPGKLNFEIKEGQEYTEHSKIRGFITEYCVETPYTFTYIPFGTARPKVTYPSQMVLKVEKLKMLCELLRIDIVVNEEEMSERDTVRDLFYCIVGDIQEHISSRGEASDVLIKNVCAVCGKECLMGDNKFYEGRMEQICNKCADPDKRDAAEFERYRENYDIPSDSELTLSKDSFFSSHWEEAYESCKVKDLIIADDDWRRTQEMFEDPDNEKMTSYIYKDNMRLIRFRITLEYLLIDHWNTHQDEKFPYKSHADFVYKERYNPWLKLWKLFQKIFTMFMH